MIFKPERDREVEARKALRRGKFVLIARNDIGGAIAIEFSAKTFERLGREILRMATEKNGERS